MGKFDFSSLDETIHNKYRLAVMSILVTVESAEFVYLRDQVGLTDGNLASHLKKLEEAEYISVEKRFHDRKPQTLYSATPKGKQAFATYVAALRNMLGGLPPVK